MGSNRCATMTYSFLGKALLIALVWGLYFPALSFDFAYDDFLRIVQERLVRSDHIAWADIAEIFLTATYPGDLYRPLSTLGHRLIHIFFGLNPLAFHAEQLILHSLCTLLIFELLQALSLPFGLSWIASAWFAVHPMNVEVVANPSGQPELLALFFSLLAMFSNHAGARAHEPVQRTGLGLLSALLFACAVFAKESALTFLLLIPLCGWQRKIPWRALLYPWAWLVVTCVAVLLLRKIALGERFMVGSVNFLVSENPLLHGALGISGRLYPALVTLGDYIAQLFLPIHLSSDYSIPPPLFWARVFSLEGTLAASIPLLFLLFVLRHRSTSWGVFGLWFFVAFSLTTNIVTPIGTLRGDRLAYTPSIGFCVFVAGLLGHYIRPWLASSKGCAIHMIAFGTVLAYAWRSHERLPVWRDQDTLFLATVKDAPLSPKAIENAGSVWFDSFKNPVRAERYFTRALSLDPTRVFSMKYMLNINIARGNLAEARAWCVRILNERPEDTEIQQNKREIEHVMSTPAHSTEN